MHARDSSHDPTSTRIPFTIFSAKRTVCVPCLQLEGTPSLRHGDAKPPTSLPPHSLTLLHFASLPARHRHFQLPAKQHPLTRDLIKKTTKIMPQQQQQPPHYTLILRLPFPRPQNQAFSTPTIINSSNEPHLQTHDQNQNHSTQQTQTLDTTPNQHLPQPPATSRRSPATAPPTGSEGTPSMGSSFSDLSGASVAQSALEEALMSDLRADGGGLGSRVSSVGR